MRFCHPAIVSINRDLEDSASMCGAGNFVVLYRIVVPLASPAIIATSIYVFMHAIRDLSCHSAVWAEQQHRLDRHP
jgi:iron(III) transport system permease protein